MVVLWGKNDNKILFFFLFLFLQSPPKGATIPYRPKPQVNGPVILANGQAYTIQGNYAVPTQEVIIYYLYKFVVCFVFVFIFLLFTLLIYYDDAARVSLV